MIYLTCSLDGNSHGRVQEGAGSLIEFLLSCFSICKRHGISFAYIPIKNIGHFKYHTVNQESWDLIWNDYIKSNMLYDIISLPEGISKSPSGSIESLLTVISRLSHDKEVNICFDTGTVEKQHHRDISLLNGIKDSLREHYHKSTKSMECYFSPDKVNIAIHIRRFTETDCCTDERRELYTEKNFMKDFFLNVIKRLRELYPESIVHIYSQGPKDDFTPFQDIPQLIMHLNEHPITTLHHMIKANILVMSKSSFSYIASVYSKGIKLMKNRPIVPMISDVREITDDGFSFTLSSN